MVKGHTMRSIRHTCITVSWYVCVCVCVCVCVSEAQPAVPSLASSYDKRLPFPFCPGGGVASLLQGAGLPRATS